MTRLVRAAGGVVFRKTNKGNLRILVAHRPGYDDWSFPKGKTEKKETPEQTAVREVLEETGYHCRIVSTLGTTRYRIPNGVKEVHWYAMRPLPDSPGFKKNAEIDRVKWLSRKRALEILDYDNDRGLLGDADLKSLSQTGTIHLLRHAAAGDRDKWDGEDRARPITKKGARQVAALTDALSGRGIERVLSSPYLRCLQTVEPIAEAIGAKVEVSIALAEGPDIDAAYELVDSLIGQNSLVCTHGDVIPAVVNRMMWAGLSLENRFYCSKGSIWEVEVLGGRFSTGRYIPPPDV